MTHPYLRVMELNNFSRFIRLLISDAEQALRKVLVIFGGEKFHRQADIMQVHSLSFRFRPIWMAFDLFLFHELVEHENCFWFLLPNHQPEMTDGLFERSLTQDVLSLGAVELHKVCVYVVGVNVLPGQHDSRVIVGIHISVSIRIGETTVRMCVGSHSRSTLPVQAPIVKLFRLIWGKITFSCLNIACIFHALKKIKVGILM